MKNALLYYYNLEPNNIHQINKIYKFNINNDYYVLSEINVKDINDIYNLSIYLNKKGIYTNQIIINNQNSLITIINQINYVLIKSTGNLDKVVELNDIVQFNSITKGIDKKIDSWYQLWINKLDYFEYQINELENKYPLIKESFNYFSGLVETGIELLINLPIKNNLCVCHKRIKKNTTLFDLYNPINFIVDNNIRDASEYFKALFMDEDPYPLIQIYVKKLSEDELKLFFIRMLYPSFYFDTYEEIIEDKLPEIEIKKIINKIPDYELLLKKTYTLIRNICFLPEIDWLIK